MTSARTGAIAKTLRLFRALALADSLNFARDAFFLFLVVMPIPVALAIRFFLPDLEGVLRDRLDFEFAPYHPMLMGVFAGMAPSLIGAVYGLVFVEERDERTLAALRVTPAPFASILAARMIAPVGLSVILTIAAYPIAGLTPLPIWTVAAIALSSASVVPVAALTVISFAPNKLTGLVMFRLVNLALALPALAFIAAPGWDLIAWPLSSYWPMKALWLAAEGRAFWAPLLVAPVLNAAMTVWLFGRFARSAEP